MIIVYVFAHHALQNAVLGMAADTGALAAAGCRPVGRRTPSGVDRHGMPRRSDLRPTPVLRDGAANDGGRRGNEPCQ